jgi:hypothetical protein
LLPVPAVSLVILAVLSPPLAAGPWQGTETTRDGVPWVENPALPTEAPVTLPLQELWRIGGDSAEEGQLFGVIGAVQTDTAGNVYLLDRQLSEVKVFSPDGEYLRTLGREGEGPGEFRRPVDLLFTPDGNVGVIQLVPGKIVLLSPEGDPSGDLDPSDADGGRLTLWGGEGAGDHLVLGYSTTRMQPGKMTRRTVLAAYDLEGNETVLYHESEDDMDFANPVVDETKGLRPTWALGPEGRAYAVTTFGEYAVHVWKPDGTPLRVQTRTYEHLPRTKQEMEDQKKRIIFRGPVEPKIVVSDYHPDVRYLYPRADGSLWVLTSRGTKNTGAGTLGTFDVFDADGRFVRQITLAGQGDPEEDLYFLSGDRVFVVTQFVQAARSMFGGSGPDAAGEDTEAEPLPMEVICYALPQVASQGE